VLVTVLLLVCRKKGISSLHHTCSFVKLYIYIWSLLYLFVPQGAKRPTPTQSTCLYYDLIMKLVSVYLFVHCVLENHLGFPLHTKTQAWKFLHVSFIFDISSVPYARLPISVQYPRFNRDWCYGQHLSEYLWKCRDVFLGFACSELDASQAAGPDYWDRGRHHWSEHATRAARPWAIRNVTGGDTSIDTVIVVLVLVVGALSSTHSRLSPMDTVLVEPIHASVLSYVVKL
jgi:hypothetical protein